MRVGEGGGNHVGKEMVIDETVIATLRANKANIALPWADMDRLETFLGKSFGIKKLPDNYDLLAAIRDACGDDVAEQYQTLNERQLQTSDPCLRSQTKNAFYDLISTDPLLGLVHSTRWPYILDGAAYLTALIRALGIEGPFIDIGCHAGYHALWLATECGITGRGVDISQAAVKYARERTADFGISPGRLVFDSQTIKTRAPVGGYALVYSINGPITLAQRSFEEVSSILGDGGVFVWVGQVTEYEPKSLCEDLIKAGMTLLFGDVIGGWDGKAFLVRVVLVIAEGAEFSSRENVTTEIESVWKGFSDYCNTEGRMGSEKTLSKYRSWLTYG